MSTTIKIKTKAGRTSDRRNIIRGCGRGRTQDPLHVANMGRERGQTQDPSHVANMGRTPNPKSAIRVGSWNVRTMSNKKTQVDFMACKYGIDILALQETRAQKEQNEIDDYGFLLGAADKGIGGVGFWFEKKLRSSVLCTNVLNHRMATARIDIGKYKLSIIKASDAEYAKFLSDIEQEHRAVPKSDKLIILGDFNAKVGTPKDDDVCGGWSVGERNCRGDMVVDMCQTNDLSLVNTYFQHSRARLTTWRSPDHQTENTIDYVLTRKKDRSSTTDAIALGGADADSDDKLLKATFRWKW